MHEMKVAALLLLFETLLPLRDRHQHNLGSIPANRLKLVELGVVPNDEQPRDGDHAGDGARAERPGPEGLHHVGLSRADRVGGEEHGRHANHKAVLDSV